MSSAARDDGQVAAASDKFPKPTVTGIVFGNPNGTNHGAIETAFA
jgi:hypothetical protein